MMPYDAAVTINESLVNSFNHSLTRVNSTLRAEYTNRGNSGWHTVEFMVEAAEGGREIILDKYSCRSPQEMVENFDHHALRCTLKALCRTTFFQQKI